jgi:2-iminobutanoate/2-iminopropanoate deaminase
MNGQTTRRKFLAGTATGAGVAAGALGMEATAQAASTGERFAKKVVTRPGQKMTPAAVLSPGIQFGNLIFVSGQSAHDPATQKLASGTFQDQVRQCLENVKAIVEASGSSMDKVLKCNVFLTDIANFQSMNEVYHTFFPENPPARSTVAVKDLPGATPIEIECIAYTN